jgi:hypothetical protein
MEKSEDNRRTQIAIGASILLTLAVLVPGLLVGWHYMPGFLGEWIGTIMGILTTPFIMETSFILLGIGIVVSLNHWRRIKQGDDFVYLDQVDGPQPQHNLPDHASWAVYLEKPLDPIPITLLEQAEGAFAIGDYSHAMECIGAMERKELRQNGTTQLRLELARATGRDDLIAALEKELARQP